MYSDYKLIFFWALQHCLMMGKKGGILFFRVCNKTQNIATNLSPVCTKIKMIQVAFLMRTAIVKFDFELCPVETWRTLVWFTLLSSYVIWLVCVCVCVCWPLLLPTRNHSIVHNQIIPKPFVPPSPIFKELRTRKLELKSKKKIIWYWFANWTFGHCSHKKTTAKHLVNKLLWRKFKWQP